MSANLSTNLSTNPILAVSNRLRATPFTERVKKHGAKAFTIYNHMLLPTEFASLEEDYWHLCEHVQVWDVSVERQVDIKGPDAQKLVQWMTPRDISKVDVGRCVYVPLADEDGYIINDPIALKLADDHWWLSIADSDVVLWAKGLATGAKLDVKVHEPDVWPLAIQGPKAEELVARVLGDAVKDIKFFRFQPMAFKGYEFNVARSGWSKQGGFEIYVNDAKGGEEIYDALFAAGEDLQVRSGCPNLIERMESGLLSYGNDMTSDHTVLESGIDSFFDINIDADSLSLAALREQKKQGLQREIIGLVIDAPNGAVAASVENGCLLKSDGQAIGRLGSQVWSPKYRHQLLTVMFDKVLLERAMSDKSAAEKVWKGRTEGNMYVELAMQDGTSAKARMLKFPFDFQAAGIIANKV